MRFRQFALVTVLMTLLFCMNTAAATEPVRKPGVAELLNEADVAVLCKTWERDAYNEFFQELTRLGHTISDVYYELDCILGADKGMDLFRMSFRTPATTEISADKLRRQLAKENPTQLSCILTDIEKRSMNLISYLVWDIRKYKEDLAMERAKANPDAGFISNSVRSIGAQRNAEYDFRRHLIENLTQHPSTLDYIDWQKNKLNQYIEAENEKPNPDPYDLEDYQTDLKDLIAAEIDLKAEMAKNPVADPEGICPDF